MELKQLLEKNGFEFEQKIYDDLEVFISLLKQWGKTHNLTGSLENQDIYENILDSLYPLKFINIPDSFADIGTGAGYPGLILAIVLRDVKSYLIEPRIKRVSFLNFVKMSLKLENLRIICNRVENVKDLKVDLISSRAVSNISLLFDISKNIEKQNSSFLFYKGSLVQKELDEVRVQDYQIVKRKDRNYLYIKRK